MVDSGRKTLLVIDDEMTFCIAVKEYLESERLEVLMAHSLADGRAVCSRHWVDLVLLDQRLPDGDGYTLVPSILEKNDLAKIIFVTAYPSFENAVRAVRTGAHDYLSKPLDMEELKLVVISMLRTQGLEQVVQLRNYEQEREREQTVIVGVGGGLAGVERLMESATQTDSPVLITGETGTGKNLISKDIHYRSARSRGPFVEINCSALPESLIEAELFGSERGAYTGSVATKKGLFEMADGGSLFLDEIGEMPLHLQPKLLSVIDDGVVRRIGGTSFRRVKVRVIAATNTDLEVQLGKTFRRDLYYRLSVIRIHVPPLRERKQDLPELCEHILKRVLGRPHLSLTKTEQDRLAAYDWPGNVRELKNVLERAALVQQNEDYYPSRLLVSAQAASNPCESAQPSGEPAYGSITLAEYERRLIAATLRHFQGNIAQTARSLDMSLSTLKRRIVEYGIARTTGPD
jgi:DNA-binding NtrC family response regulator